MGLLKTIRSKRNLRHLRRKEAAAQSNASPEVDKTYEFHVTVTSTPKEYSLDSTKSFNWLTHQVDDFEMTDCGTADDTLSRDGTNTDMSYEYTPSDGDGWAWLSSLVSCWGPSSAVNKTDDPTFASSCDETEESSQAPSMSRLDQVLKLPPMKKTVSDITSAASMDDSDSDSESDNGD